MFHYCCASQYGFAEATIRSLGLNSKIVDPMEALHADTCSCVNVDGVMSTGSRWAVELDSTAE